jgi:hypothetical protein
MAFEAVQDTFTAPAAADLSAYQFYACSYDANANLTLAAAGKNMDGILQGKPKAGEAAQFCRDGYSKAAITAGVAITIGELLQVDTGGTFTAAGTGTAVAKALQSIAAGGTVINYITVEILRSNAAFS